MKRSLLAHFLGGLLIAAASPAFADTVTLKNKDVLTGTIDEVSPTAIILTTAYAGKITIARIAINTLQSDHAVAITHSDGSTTRRYLSPATTSPAAATATAMTPATQPTLGWLETETPNVPRTGIAPPPIAVATKTDAPPKRFTHYLDFGPSWKNQLTLGAVNASGNDNTASVDFGVNLHYQKTTDEFTFKFESLYGTSNGAQTEGLVDQNAVYRHDLTSRLYSYASDDVRYDAIKGISLQAQMSAGLGYYLFRGKRFKLDLRAGPGAEYLKTFDGNSDIAPSGEAGIRAAYDINDRVSASQETTYTTSLLDDNVWRVHSESVLNYKLDLERGLGLKLSYNDDYENQPSHGRKRNDSRVALSLTFDF